MRATPRKRAVPISSRTVNSVRGALYDMQHYDQLPPVRSGAPVSNVLSFVVTRDGRFPYILLSVTLVLIVSALIMILRSLHK